MLIYDDYAGPRMFKIMYMNTNYTFQTTLYLFVCTCVRAYVHVCVCVCFKRLQVVFNYILSFFLFSFFTIFKTKTIKVETFITRYPPVIIKHEIAFIIISAY